MVDQNGSKLSDSREIEIEEAMSNIDLPKEFTISKESQNVFSKRISKISRSNPLPPNYHDSTEICISPLPQDLLHTWSTTLKRPHPSARK